MVLRTYSGSEYILHKSVSGETCSINLIRIISVGRMKSHGHIIGAEQPKEQIARISFSRMPKTKNTKTKNEPMNSNKIKYYISIELH